MQEGQQLECLAVQEALLQGRGVGDRSPHQQALPPQAAPPWAWAQAQQEAA